MTLTDSHICIICWSCSMTVQAIAAVFDSFSTQIQAWAERVHKCPTNRRENNAYCFNRFASCMNKHGRHAKPNSATQYKKSHISARLHGSRPGCRTLPCPDWLCCLYTHTPQKKNEHKKWFWRFRDSFPILLMIIVSAPWFNGVMVSVNSQNKSITSQLTEDTPKTKMKEGKDDFILEEWGKRCGRLD